MYTYKKNNYFLFYKFRKYKLMQNIKTIFDIIIILICNLIVV